MWMEDGIHFTTEYFSLFFRLVFQSFEIEGGFEIKPYFAH